MWNSIQCAVQGRSHVKAGVPCQDKTFYSSANDVQVIALADGAGSAKLSHFGAGTVTKFICSELSEQFDFYFAEEDGVIVKQQIMSGVIRCLQEQAAELKCEVKDLASTLLFVAVKDGKFIIAHIGDGVIGYLKEDELKIASQPENGEFVNTTIFTTSKDALMTMKLIKGSLGQIRGFILMSDGTEVSLYNKKEKRLADVLKKIMKMSILISPAKIEEQLQQSFAMVVSQATTDDCSIAILMDDRDEFKGFMKLSHCEKCTLLKIKSNSSKKRIKRYSDILLFLQKGQSLVNVARYIHLKPKYAKRYVQKLCELNLIEKTDHSYYQTLVKMN